MSLLKRACLYLVRKTGKTVTLLVFLLVMATLMLTCFSIQSATKTANANIKKALLGYFTINAKQLDTGITEDAVKQIHSIDGLSGYYALHSYSYANGLSVGDTMQLGSIMDKTRTIEVMVAGIFTNTKEQDSIGIAPSYDLYDNIVFTDLSTSSYLLYGADGKICVQYGDFYVNDPDELDRIMEQVQEIDGVDWDSCTMTRYDKDHQNAKKSLEGLQNIVFIAVAVVSCLPCF